MFGFNFTFTVHKTKVIVIIRDFRAKCSSAIPFIISGPFSPSSRFDISRLEVLENQFSLCETLKAIPTGDKMSSSGPTANRVFK